MKKFLFTVSTICILCMIEYIADAKYTPQGPLPSIIQDIYFGVSNVSPPTPWSCDLRPSDNFYRDHIDSNRNIFNLVTFPYDNFGNQFWMEYGAQGKYFCLDDDTYETPFCTNQIKMTDINVSVAQLVWIQLVSQCHQCGDFPNHSGSWWKYEFLYGANTLGSCNVPPVFLSLQSNNTVCTPNTDFGCGPDEVQE